MKLCKLLLAVVGASVLLGALVGTASASRLSISSRTFRATWASAEYGGGFGTVRCNLTLEGSLRSFTITKTRGLEIGSITAARVGTCAAGSATVLTETLPWRIQYDSFSGVLPGITRLLTRLVNLGLQILEPFFRITCLARSEAAEPATNTYNLTGSSVTSVTLGGTMLCSEAISGTLAGTSSTNSAVTITLI